MKMWRWIGAFVFAVGVTCFVSTQFPAFGQDKDKKEPDKKAEQKAEEKKDPTPAAPTNTFTLSSIDGAKPAFFQELTTETKQDMTVMGQNVTQNQKQTFFVKWTPQAKDSAGNYVVKQQIVAVKMSIDIGGNKISIDTKDSKLPKNPMTDFFTALTAESRELTFTITPDLKVSKIDGRDQLIKALGDTNPQMTQLLNIILGEDALKQMAEPTWYALPQGKAEKGTTWSKDNKLDLGPIGAYKTNFKYTYEGSDGKLDKIKMDITMNYDAPTKEKMVGLPFVIKSAKLESKKGGGEALFSREKGRFESSTTTMELEGTLNIEVGNMETPIQLKQTQTATVKTHDTDPTGGAKK